MSAAGDACGGVLLTLALALGGAWLVLAGGVGICAVVVVQSCVVRRTSQARTRTRMHPAVHVQVPL